MIAQAKGLVQDLSPSGAFADAGVPFAEALVENLSSLIGAAEAAWAQARGKVAAAQERQQELRAAARELQGHLITFRQLLLDSVGLHHTDYQTLRLPRPSDTTDEGESIEAESAPDEGLLDEPPSDAVPDDSGTVEAPTHVSDESTGHARRHGLSVPAECEAAEINGDETDLTVPLWEGGSPRL